VLSLLCQLEAALSNPSTVHSIVQGSRELAADPIAIGLTVLSFYDSYLSL